MKRSKLYLALFSLGPKERKRFREYVHSPFFNKNKKVQFLCDLLLANLNIASDKPLSKEKLFREIYKQEEYQELKLNNVISDLLQLLLDFFACSRYQKDTLFQQKLIGRALIERELYQHFNSLRKRYDQLRKKSSVKNYQYFLEEYEYHELLDQFSLSGDKRTYSNNLQAKSDMLDLYYFANKFRMACDMKSRNRVINAGYTPYFLGEMLKRYEKKKGYYGKIPALKLYHVVIQMLEEGETEAFYFELKKILEESSDVFPPEELNTVYSYALNYCVQKINTGRSEFYKEILSLYKMLLERELLFTNGFLSQWDYNNIITSALRLDEFDWTENFIHEYKNSLIPDERFNVYTSNLAAFYFAKKDYDNALQLLHEVEFTDPFYQAAAKIIQLKVYFEIDEQEAFFSLSEAFKQFVNRNKQFSGYQKETNLNFLKAANWVFKDKIKLEAFRGLKNNTLAKKTWSKIQALNPLANKGWIMEIAENNL
jgi:hypothetical protein